MRPETIAPSFWHGAQRSFSMLYSVVQCVCDLGAVTLDHEWSGSAQLENGYKSSTVLPGSFDGSRSDSRVGYRGFE